MNAGVATAARASEAPGEVHDLERGFALFNDVASNLQRVFSKLDERAAAVEGRLSQANRSLVHKVEELETVTQELNGLMEAIPCGVVAMDHAGLLFRVNPAAERILGRPAQELVGRSAVSLGGDGLLAMADPQADCGRTHDRVVTCLDGAVRHLESTVAALVPQGRLEVIVDRTEVAHLRSQVHRLDHLAALGEMAANVAHEVRNPMNGVEGFAGLLEKGLAAQTLPKDAALRYVSRIRQGIGEVNGIITNLLVWARPETLQTHPLSPAELGEELIEDARHLAETAGKELSFVLRSEPELPHLEGDRLKIKLALSNVLRNALEVAASRVTLLIGHSDGEIAFRVEDDGPGIDPQVASKLFVPFVTTKSSGTGLGLAIARKFATLHGGEIKAREGELCGACFEMRLPLAATGGERA